MVGQQIRIDAIHNGRAFGGGGVAARLLRNGMNSDIFRPWIGRDGGSYYTTRDPLTGKLVNRPVANYDTPATLLKDEWIFMERELITPVLPKLQIWDRLNQTVGGMVIPNGMATTEIEQQTESDAGFVTVSMNGLARSDRDRPEYDTRKFPIPILHGEFSIDIRHLMQTRAQGRPFDVSMGRNITRRLGEKVQKMAIGEATTFSANGNAIYGLTTHPNRYTKSLTLPTSAGWTPRVLVDEVIEMQDTLNQNEFHGPYAIYYSPLWMKYMGQDYSDAYPGQTLKKRLGELDGFSFIEKLDYGLSDYQVIVFQLTEDVIRTLNGLDIRTFQWEEKGGWELLFKVACIYLTQLRTRENDDLGVVHGNAA